MTLIQDLAHRISRGQIMVCKTLELQHIMNDCKEYYSDELEYNFVLGFLKLKQGLIDKRKQYTMKDIEYCICVKNENRYDFGVGTKEELNKMNIQQTKPVYILNKNKKNFNFYKIR